MYTVDMKPYQVIVTTSRYPTLEMQTRASQLAERFQCSYETRDRKTITAFLQKTETVYMVGKDGRDRLYAGEGEQPFFFTRAWPKYGFNVSWTPKLTRLLRLRDYSLETHFWI